MALEHLQCARHYLIKFYLHNNPDKLAFIAPFSGIENGLRKVKGLSQGHSAKKWKNWHLK